MSISTGKNTFNETVRRVYIDMATMEGCHEEIIYQQIPEAEIRKGT